MAAPLKDWRRLRGRQVLVLASGVEYRGVVVELGERSLLLRAPGGHREIPWERITRVTGATAPNAAPRSLNPASALGDRPSPRRDPETS